MNKNQRYFLIYDYFNNFKHTKELFTLVKFPSLVGILSFFALLSLINNFIFNTLPKYTFALFIISISSLIIYYLLIKLFFNKSFIIIDAILVLITIIYFFCGISAFLGISILLFDMYLDTSLLSIILKLIIIIATTLISFFVISLLKYFTDRKYNNIN